MDKLGFLAGVAVISFLAGAATVAGLGWIFGKA